MKYLAALLAVFLTVAATPPPAPMSTRLHSATTFHNPGSEKTHPMSGQGCVSGPGANRAATTVNPVNGHAQAATIISIPITKGGGSVANATTHKQQAEACAHTH
jgi:hypothetical protein